MNNKYLLMPLEDEKVSEIEVLNIPFKVKKDGENIMALPLNHKHQFDASEKCSYAFILGMVPERPEASEWWQQEEANYANHSRVFFGDNLCYIFIVYEDETEEVVPAIFGYNVFNYELYTPLKPYEGHLNNYGGPYREPFESDKEAKQLLDAALCLNENENGGKGEHYIMAVKLKDKPVKLINTRKAPPKIAGLHISSVTCLKTGESLPESITKVLDPTSFYNRAYSIKLEKLARRLYQFKDDIPEHIDHIIPSEYEGPLVNFKGNNVADILTNVYHINLNDMATQKVTEDGMPHTSSQHMPNFSLYIGMGTFKVGEGGYFKHIWTRDVGRQLIELTRAGLTKRVQKAAEHMHRYLYDKSDRFKMPNWKRIANAAELWAPDGDTSKIHNLSGKENDGHAAIMMFIYELIRTNTVNNTWVRQNKQAIYDAAGWYFWQIENPEESGFDKVLYSESEASAGEYGAVDLFSNAISYCALVGYSRIGNKMGWSDLEAKCDDYAKLIMKGIYDVFTLEHPKYGRIFVDNTYDAWTYEYKRFGLLFEMVDLFNYEPMRSSSDFEMIIRNTMNAQMDEFYSPYSGRQMGYGQGYITQTMLLMDKVEEYTKCLEATAYYCYHNHDFSYIVPEGVITHPTKRYWFRNCDLGNAVQQAETIKSIRLMIGIDDNSNRDGISFIPRLPLSFNGIEVKDYAVMSYDKSNNYEGSQIKVNYTYSREGDGYQLSFDSKEPVLVNKVRVGPFNIGEAIKSSFLKEYEYTIKTIGEYDYVYVNVNKYVSELDIKI